MKVLNYFTEMQSNFLIKFKPNFIWIQIDIDKFDSLN